ncbi:MAG: acyl-CoA thioester hydrolase/BAAT C-terminal domain-containing protein [Vicinamibacterales bacterium]|nr:acyl-CoA thioester hydrolase/BAAT C-terminal domain-containing protein [Vicinamibacterales bacterium]
MSTAAACALLVAVPAGQYRTLNDRFAPPHATSRAGWEQRAAAVRDHVLASAGLLPLPERTPLRAVVSEERQQQGYRVSRVYFESLPGFFVTGNLYRPDGEGPFPAVLSAHGHWPYGRLEHNDLMSGPGRAMTLARQGFVVFAHDMIGYNDSRQLTHSFGGRDEYLWGLSLAGLQLWNSMRAVDFLESLPYVRQNAIGMTGESGGGTQTFLLAAVDPRIAAAVPVNMISLHMQGGCLCENPPGLRLDTTNVEIAATIAPRPLLMVSATGDWTKDTLNAEFPAVRALYDLLDARARVRAVQFMAPHNYNKDSREAMYAWMAQWLQGKPAAERVAEPAFTPDSLQDLLVFHGRLLPDGAATAASLTGAWIDAARRQLDSTPLAVRATALRHALTFYGTAPPPAPGGASAGDRRPRRPVLLAGGVAGYARALQSAGFAVQQIPAMPFDTAAAATVRHFDTYNRTPASQRVADIVEALRATPDAIVVAAGNEALAAVLAAAVEWPRLVIADVGGFDTDRDGDFLEHAYVPGLRRAGDFRTASEVARGRIVIHNAGAVFAAPGARVERRTLSPTEVVGLVREASRGSR